MQRDTLTARHFQKGIPFFCSICVNPDLYKTTNPPKKIFAFIGVILYTYYSVNYFVYAIKNYLFYEKGKVSNDDKESTGFSPRHAQ